MQQFEITLKGASFSDVVNQARQLVIEAEAFRGTATPTVTKATPTKTKAPVKKLEAVDADDELAGDIEIGDEAEETDELSFDDETEDEVEEVQAAPAKTAKTTKAKKLTEKDVNAAAMAHAKVHGRQKTLALLTKKFKRPIKSILELKPDQYETAVQVLEV